MARQLPRGNWGLWAWNFLGPGRPGLILEKTRLQSYLHWNRCFFEFKDWDVVLEASLLWKVYMAAVTDSGGHSDIWIRFSFSSCLWPPQVPFLQQPGRPSPVNTFEHGLDRFEQIWTDLNMVFQMFDLIWSHCEVPLSAASCELRAYEVITLTCATGCSTDTMARHSTGATESVSRKTSVTSVTSVSDSNWLGVLNVLRAKGGSLEGWGRVAYDLFWRLATGRRTSDIREERWRGSVILPSRPILPSPATARWRMEILQPMELAAQVSPGWVVIKRSGMRPCTCFFWLHSCTLIRGFTRIICPPYPAAKQ